VAHDDVMHLGRQWTALVTRRMPPSSSAARNTTRQHEDKNRRLAEAADAISGQDEEVAEAVVELHMSRVANTDANSYTRESKTASIVDARRALLVGCSLFATSRGVYCLVRGRGKCGWRALGRETLAELLPCVPHAP
jgi:hypothetical protein